MMPFDEQLEQRLNALVTVFLEENQKLNLSAFRTEDACRIGNVLDSLALLDAKAFSSFPKNFSVLDIGTGGGFPLLPLALTLHESTFTGLDSTKKKIDAIQRMVDALTLANVQLLDGRAEELGHDALHREAYDVVTARAVAPINTLLELMAPFAKVGGHMVLWKSMNIEQELKDALMARAELSCHLEEQYVYELPDDWGKRQLLIFEKRFQTKEIYPRETGIPKKDPLK